MPEETRAMAVDMLRLLAPLSLVMVFVAVATSRLQAVHDHSYALADALPPLTILLLLLAWKIDGGLPLVVGTLGGFVLQAWWLERRALCRDGLSFAVSLPPRSEQWAFVSRSFLVMGAGQLLLSFASPIDQWVAASLGAGENATLGYANRILAMAMTVGAAAISRSTLPVFSEGVAGGQAMRVHRHALHWSLLMLGAGLGAALLLAVAAPWLVGLLFERGAFSPTDTRMVATALQAGALQLPPYFAALVLVSLLASKGMYGLLTAAGAVSLAVKLAGNYALAPALGVPGLLLATAAMYGFSALVCFAAVVHAKRQR
jgi:peptidoglycan biosynthesis protein MviN/MurJ (putative lipid II flippase)